MTTKKSNIYFEPMDYFPEEVRKEFKLGEYSETNKANKTKKPKKTTAKKTITKKK